MAMVRMAAWPRIADIPVGTRPVLRFPPLGKMIMRLAVIDPSHPPYFFAPTGVGLAVGFVSDNDFSSLRLDIARNPSSPIPRIIAERLT